MNEKIYDDGSGSTETVKTFGLFFYTFQQNKTDIGKIVEDSFSM